jgi:hypothetical protein
LLEGARRVGKSTIAEHFAKNEYKTYMMIDFSKASDDVKDILIPSEEMKIEAYVERKNFTVIDRIKREIITLYEEDFNKIDPSGRISSMYHSIPAQLSKDGKHYLISKATGKRGRHTVFASLFNAVYCRLRRKIL